MWRDIEKLWPGQDWKIEISRAITDSSLAFIACISANSTGREKTVQNEELILAAEQMRLRPPGLCCRALISLTTGGGRAQPG